MPPFGITRTGPSSLRLDGFPDAVKVIRVDGFVARRLADLALHRSDLTFALECVQAIERLPEDQGLIRKALWRSAVVHYAKCFGNSKKRFQLDPASVHKDCPPATHQAFEFFKSFRNKHIVHDENAYKQSVIGAAINAGNKPFKVEKVVAPAFTFEVHGPDDVHKQRP